jgi:hypothetical protein
VSRDLDGPSLFSFNKVVSGDNLALGKVGSIQDISGDMDNFTPRCKIYGPSGSQ